MKKALKNIWQDFILPILSIPFWIVLAIIVYSISAIIDLIEWWNREETYRFFL